MRKHYVVWQKIKKDPIDKCYVNNKPNEPFTENDEPNTDPRYTLYNPDILPESANPYYIHDHADLNDKVHDLLQKARKLLNKKEWRVFMLLTGWQGQPPMTQKDAALKLGMTQGRVSQIWEDVRQQLCEEWEK